MILLSHMMLNLHKAATLRKSVTLSKSGQEHATSVTFAVRIQRSRPGVGSGGELEARELGAMSSLQTRVEPNIV